ncbi:MAG TPA: hypothetical protein VGC41_19460, partial [Kofleriaceae bacterium]
LPMCASEQGPGGYLAHQVAQVGFKDGGHYGFDVIQNGTTLDIRSWETSDGACTNKKGDFVACPRPTKHFAYVTVPAKAQLEEKIVIVDEKGVRTPFSCSADD